MPTDVSELDQLQSSYKAAVEEWIAVIRREEALASNNHSVEEIDEWEKAAYEEDAARKKAKVAKSAYEEALRHKFFDF